MKNRISSLAQLQEEKRKLKLKREVSKQLFFDSLGQTRKTATHLLTNKVLLPAGITGVVAWGAGKLATPSGDENANGKMSGEKAASASFFEQLLKELLPLGTKLLNDYLQEATHHET